MQDRKGISSGSSRLAVALLGSATLSPLAFLLPRAVIESAAMVSRYSGRYSVQRQATQAESIAIYPLVKVPASSVFISNHRATVDIQTGVLLLEQSQCGPIV